VTISKNSQLPTGLHLFKYHTLGNSYLIIDPHNCNAAAGLFDVANGNEPIFESRVAKILCDKTRGIGSNGLLIGPSKDSNRDTFQLKIVNSDGTSSGFSGNGVRIFAKFLLDSGYVSIGQSFTVETTEYSEQGVSTVNNVPVSIAAVDGLIQVSIPHAPIFGSDAIVANPKLVQPNDWEGLNANLSHKVLSISEIGSLVSGLHSTWCRSTLLDIGNPHCVTFVETEKELPDFATLKKFDESLHNIAFRPKSALLAHSPFARGANLQWALVRSRSLIDLMIYERGEGPTSASGSSASAAASAAFARGLVDEIIDVSMPGGTLSVEINGVPDAIRAVTLTGSATKIFEGWVDGATPINSER